MRIADQQTCLSAPAVADHDELLAVLGRRRDVGSRAAGCVDCAVAPSRRPSVTVAACEEGFAAVLALEIVESRIDRRDGHDEDQ